MLTVPEWRLDPPTPRPGEPGPLVIGEIDQRPTKWPICIVPGSLARRVPEGTIVRMLDKDDIANARLIAAAPRMRAVIEGLLIWAGYMGGWDSACWADAANLRPRLRNPPEP